MTLLICLAVLGLVVWGWRAGMKAAPNELGSPGAVVATLQYLLDRGINDGQVRFEVRTKPSDQFLFVKYILKQNDVGLRSFFYEKQNTQRVFEHLREEFVQRGIKHEETRAPDSTRCLTVDYGHDIGLAHLVVRLVFERVFGVRLEKDCVAYFEGVLISDKPALTGVDVKEQ